jgi:hypothetical protein
LIPASIEFSAGDVLGVDNQGRVTFEMLSRGRQAAQLPLTEYLKDITGQEIGTAMAFLYEKLPLRDYPSVSVWPNWFGRVPYMSTRIKSVIVTAG